MCWAHLKRDFQSWVDAAGSGAAFGSEILSRIDRIFILWRALGNGEIDRPTFAAKMRKHQIAVGTSLTMASDCDDTSVSGMAKQILKLESALWAFVHCENVEPTNNYAERLIRSGVIWRKLCFGTDAIRGSRFAERVLTVIATLRLQKRHLLNFLTEAYTAALGNTPAPTLLPA